MVPKFLRMTLVFLVAGSSMGIYEPLATAQTTSATLLELLTNAERKSLDEGTVKDIQLRATAHSIHEADGSPVPMVLAANAQGQSRIEFQAPATARVEMNSGYAEDPSCNSVKGGVQHETATLNCVAANWYFPMFALSAARDGQLLSAKYVGLEGGKHHIELTRIFKGRVHGTPKALASMEKFSAVDLYLDASTLLPTSVFFNSHPENDSNMDIPTEIRFSDYRDVGGARVPFHIQRFTNNTLVLDIEVARADINTGAPIRP